jgi:hypothetical protein
VKFDRKFPNILFTIGVVDPDPSDSDPSSFVWIRILPSSSKQNKKNLDLYCLDFFMP